MKICTRYIVLMVMPLIVNVAVALPADRFASESKLSSGHWVKVRVSDTGMQQITDEQLRQWGFSDPSKVGVYGVGGVMAFENNTFTTSLADDLHQTPTMYHDGRLIFYGESVDRLYPRSSSSVTYIHNIYDKYGYYYLSDKEEPLRIERKPYNPDTDEVPVMGEYLCAQIFQPDNTNPTKGGAYWLGPELEVGQTTTVGFDIADYSDGSTLSTSASFGYSFVAKNLESATHLDITAPASIKVLSSNDRQVTITEEDACYFSAPVSGTWRFTPQEAGVLDHSHLSWDFSITDNSSLEYAALKNVWLIYPRVADMRGLAQQPMCFIGNSADANFNILSDRKLEVWNVTDLNGIYGYETEYDAIGERTCGTFDQRFSMSSDRGRMYAFDAEGQLYSPDFAGEVANQNIHGDSAPEMVIITTATLYSQAESLARMHRARGKSVNVYTHEQILNEFSSGTAAPMAYRMMAKMFYDRDPEQFKYILLYGSATWDQRGIIDKRESEELLTYLCEVTSYLRRQTTNYSSDMYFGMLSDTYDHNRIERELPVIAVGRINVENPGRAACVNAKLKEYISRPFDPEIYATLIAISDLGDAYAHLNQTEDVEKQFRNGIPGANIVKIPLSMYPLEKSVAPQATELLHNTLFSGAGMFNYSGHGSSALFSAASIWSLNETTSLTYKMWPLAILSTCNPYDFDHGANDIASQMLFKTNGGSIASIGACRKVYLMYNGILNSALTHAYATARPGATIGDIYLAGRRAAVTDSRGVVSAMVNHMCYNLCGDPMTPLFVPDYRASITSINSKAVAVGDTATVAVAVGDLVHISGYIHNDAGETITDFNGTVKLILHDGPQDLPALNRNPQDYSGKTVMIDYDVLSTYGAKVTGGYFETDICVPMPRTPDVVNHIVLAAMNDQSEESLHRTGLGECYAMQISSTAEPAAAFGCDRPVIRSFGASIDDGESAVTFPAGSPITLTAVVSAPTGLSNATGLVGGQPRISVDAVNEVNPRVIRQSFNSAGEYVLTALVEELGIGRHTATISLADNLGQYSSRSVSFALVPKEIEASVSVEESTVRTEATINLDCAASVTRNRLIIEAADGTTVFSESDCSFPYSWNLTDFNGGPVPDGRYRVSVLVADDGGFGATPAVPLVVVKK